MKGSEFSDTGGTLNDPSILLTGPSGIRLTEANAGINLITGSYTANGVEDTQSGAGKNARLEFISSYVGDTYFSIKVSENGGNATGTYTFEIVRKS